jgi:hypothetical protein
VFAIAPGLQSRFHWPEWIAQLPPALGAVLLAVAVAVLAGARRLSSEGRVMQLSATMIVAFSLVQVTLLTAALPYYDLRPVSRYLQEQQARGVPLANIGKYHDQFQFFGRLAEPLAVVMEHDAAAWAQQHPEGVMVAYYEDAVPDVAPPPLLRAPYRGGWMAVWQGHDVADYPAVARSE